MKKYEISEDQRTRYRIIQDRDDFFYIQFQDNSFFMQGVHPHPWKILCLDKSGCYRDILSAKVALYKFLKPKSIKWIDLDSINDINGDFDWEAE